MIENKFKVEMTEHQRSFFLGADWQQYGKPFLQEILMRIRDRALQTNDDPNEWFRLQGEARRINILLDIDVMLRSTIEHKEKP